MPENSFEEMLGGIKTSKPKKITNANIEDMLPPIETKPLPQPLDTTRPQQFGTSLSVSGVPFAQVGGGSEWAPLAKSAPTGRAETIGPAVPKPNISYGQAKTIEPTKSEPSWIQRTLEFFGVSPEVFDNASETAKAQAIVERMARERGMSTQEYMISPNALEDASIAIGSFLKSFTYGVAPAVRSELTGETDLKAETPGAYVAGALGSLAGLILGPFKLAKVITAPLGFAKAFQGMGVYSRIAKEAIKEGVTIGTGMGLASAGEAAQQSTFAGSAKVMFDASISGALTGAIFGTAKGMFPGEGLETAARLATGLIGLNAYRAYETGGNPFTNRSPQEVIFDTLLDVYFLKDGLPPAEFKSFSDDTVNLQKKVDNFMKQEDLVKSIPDEALKKVASAKLETARQDLDREIDQLTKRVYSSTDAQSKGTKRLEKLQKVKAQIEAGTLKTAEDIVAAKATKKKIEEIKKETPKKTTERAKKEVVAKATVASAAKVEDRSKINQTEKPPEVAKAETEVQKIEEIEQVLNKPIDEVSEKEITDYLLDDYKREAADLEDELFRTDKESATNQAIEYAKSKSVAGSIDELFNQQMTSAKKGPDTTVWKLVNDVNRWLHGDQSIDIENTRNFLSEISTRSDEFENYFNSSEEHAAWKELASDAAKWARNVSKGKKKSTLTSLHFGLPLDEAGGIIRGWYSALRRYAEEKLPNSAVGQQILATLRKGSTKDEWDAVGLSELLDLRRKYSKDEVLKLIDEGSVEFKDVLLDSRTASDEVVRRIREAEREINASYEELRGLPDEERIELNKQMLDRHNIDYQDWDNYLTYGPDGIKENGPKFSSYVEPGGSNYKELFVTAPSKMNPEQQRLYSKLKRQEEWEGLHQDELDELTALEEQFRGSIWRDGHDDYSGIENPIVRLRMNDRFTAYEGSRIGEIESRLSNLKTQNKELTKEVNTIYKVIQSKQRDSNRLSRMRGEDADFDKYTDIYNLIRENTDKIRELEIEKADLRGEKVLFLEEIQPPIPSEQAKMPESLRKRWREIGMKRAIIYAIENGYDRVAWTTGEMQQKRYNQMLEHITEINYGKNADGTYWLNTPGNMRADFSSIKPEELNTTVGVDIANKMRNGEGGSHNYAMPDGSILEGRNLSGIDLTIGQDSGLKRLYNQDLPNVAKKLGGNVESISLEGIGKQVVDKYTFEEYALEHGLTTTEAIRAWNNDTNDPRLLEVRENFYDEWQKKAERKVVSIPSVSIQPFKAKVAQSQGFPLYMGFDPDMFKRVFGAKKKLEENKSSGDEIIDQAKGFSQYTEKARGLKSFDPIAAARMMREKFTTAMLDKSGNLRRWLLDNFGEEGYRVLTYMVRSKGASSISTKVLQQMRSEVYTGLSSKEKQVLDNLILANRMIDIGKYKKHYRFPKEINPMASKIYNALFPYIEGLTPTEANRLISFDADGNLSGGRVKAYYDWMKKPLADLLKEGLITPQEYDDLVSHNYRRIELISDIYDKKHPDIKIRGRSVYDSGIEALSLGKQTDIYEPSSEVMALEVFNRAYGRILNNAANRELLDLAKNQPDNPFVRFKEGKDSNVSIPSGWKRFYVYEKGVRRTMHLSPEFASEWIRNSSETSYRMSQLIRFVSGSPILRTFATGINWGFALANLPRDLAHIWYAARIYRNGEWNSLYNTNLPVYAGQMAADIKGIIGDAITRSGKWTDMIMEGGGFEFLTHQGRILQRGRHVEGALDKFQDVAGWLGELSEIIGRLAVRDRAIKVIAKERGLKYEEAYKDPEIRKEATFIARDYMDFGQGGWASKTLDQVIPYLNASIQGTRGLIRSFKPGSGTALSSAYKLAQFGALVSALTIAKQSMAPKTTASLTGNKDEENNLVIPYGDDYSFVDSNGRTTYPYFKIPLDPGQKFFKAFFEAATNRLRGKPIDVDRVVDSLKQLSPVSDASGILPPTISAFLGYVTNKDFWLNEAIWTQSDKTFDWTTVDKNGKWVGSSEEYIPGRTPEFYKDLGSITKLSPERIGYSLEEIFTSGTEISYILGQGYEAIFGGMDKIDREKIFVELMAGVPGVKRFTGITNPYSQYAKTIGDTKTRYELERLQQNNQFDTVVQQYLFGKGKSISDVVKVARSFRDKDTYDRLMEDFRFQRATKNLANRSFWLALRRLPVEGRAEVFVERLRNSSHDERIQLYREMAVVRRAKGIITNDFMKEVVKARRQSD